MTDAFRNISQEHFHAFLRACPLGVGFGRGRTLAAANAALLRILGAEHESQVQDRSLNDFVARDSADLFEELLRRARELGPDAGTGEIRIQRLDGTAVDAEVTFHADPGDVQGPTVLYARDLSRRRISGLQHQSVKEDLEKLVAERTAVAEERLMQLRAMAVKLTQVEHAERRRLARVLHDRVQQSLVAAKFALAVMPGRSENHATFEAWKSVSDLLDESIRCSRSLAVELCPPVLYTSGLPEALVWLARQKEKEQGLAVELIADPEAKPISDQVAAFLYEAVNELLFNVIKHAGVKRARVSLSQAAQGVIEIQVSDEGIGCDPWRKKAANGEGTGLGLLGIRERLQHLGCGFRIDSAPGKGTRVWLRAPKRLKAKDAGDSDLVYGVLDAEGIQPAAQPVPSKGKIRVLLVDDHEIVRKGVRQLLEEDPAIEVIGEAADGSMAVEMALNLRPDVIVMDVVLPKLNGIHATRRIVARLPSARIIGLSVYAQEEMAQQMLQSGATCYLPKEGPVEALLAAVKGQDGGKPPPP